MALIVLTMTLAACGSVASRNPLDSSAAPVPAGPLCPSHYNFETPGSQTAWQAPAWASGNSGTPKRVSTTAACGGWSLKESLVMSGGDAILYSLFGAMQNFDGRSLALYIRFDPPPPADLGFRPQFIDNNNNWVGFDLPVRFGIGSGWVLVERSFSGKDFQKVMALNLQIVTQNGATYSGDIYVDEINF